MLNMVLIFQVVVCLKEEFTHIHPFQRDHWQKRYSGIIKTQC